MASGETLESRIAATAADLPPPVVHALADRLATANSTDPAYLRLKLLDLADHPAWRDRIGALCDAWEATGHQAGPHAVALGLRVALAAVARERRESGRAELTWTGPDDVAVPLRHTEQALLEVIGAARQTLLVVSFAVYRVGAVAAALVAAADRGVSLRICLEARELTAQKAEYDTVRALGRAVAERAAIYVWPEERRPVVDGKRVGALHAKCAVADRNVLYVSSANLTDYALHHNLELGVLVQNGPLPGLVAERFALLIERDVLRRLE